MSKELIKITFVCKICLCDDTVERPLDMILFCNPSFNIEDDKNIAHFYVCSDCKKQFGF